MDKIKSSSFGSASEMILIIRKFSNWGILYIVKQNIKNPKKLKIHQNLKKPNIGVHSSVRYENRTEQIVGSLFFHQ